VGGTLRVRGLVAERSGRTLPLAAEGARPAAAELALAGALVAELAAGTRGLLVAERSGPAGRLVAEGRGRTGGFGAEGARGAGQVVVAEGRGTATLTLTAEALRARATGAARTSGSALPVVAEALLRAGAARAALSLVAEALRARTAGSALALVAEALRTGPTRTAGPTLPFAAAEATGTVGTARRTRSSRRFGAERGYRLGGPVHL
jgi:hypothetical protein